MFHGNGGNLGHRVPLAKVFYMKMRCNVLMMSYRGYGFATTYRPSTHLCPSYGLSEGSPSEQGKCHCSHKPFYMDDIAPQAYGLILRLVSIT